MPEWKWWDWLFLGLLLVGLVVFGWRWWMGRKDQRPTVEYLTAAEKEPVEVWVDVSGAVMNPGVYKMQENARLKDLLVVAGGLASSADRSWVEKNVNLATKIRDGQKLYIPFLENENSKVLANTKTQLDSGVIGVNSADKQALDNLWGVGEARAQSIIDNRPYASLDELVSKKVIPQSVLEKNRDRLSLD